MTKHIYLVLLNAVGILLLVTPAPAQQRAERIVYLSASPAPSPGVPAKAEGFGNRPDRMRIAQFADTFFDFELQSIGGLKVVRGQNPCKPIKETPVAGLQPSISYNLILAVNSFSFEGPEFVLDYELKKYSAGCTPDKNPLLHGSEPITAKTALRSMTRVSELLETTLEEELSPEKIVVDLAEISTSGDGLHKIKDELTAYILQRLTTQSDIKARDLRKPAPGQPDYLVTGMLFSDINGTLRFEFTILNKKGEKLKHESFSSGIDYNVIPTRIVNAIYEQRFLSGSSPANEEQIKQKALEFLCEGSFKSNTCIPAPNNAVFLLTSLTTENKGTAETFELLGDAQWATLKSQDAAESYEKAVEKRGQDAPVSLLIKAADAWYRAGSFDLASAKLERVIQLEQSHGNPESRIYLQLSQSYYFNNKYQKALDAVLKGLRKYPDDSDLSTLLKSILNQVSLEEMEPVLRLLEANKDLKAVATDLPELRQESFARPLVQRAYEDVQSANTRAKVGDSLKQLDALPPDYFSKDMRTTLEITRALWFRDVKLDTEAAISSLRRIAETGNNRAQYFLAQTFYQRAQKAREAEAKQDYEMVATLLLKVKDDRFSDFFEMFRVTNHKLGKDKVTRDFLRGELEKNPDSAVNPAEQLYFVCVNYMNDRECADKALPGIGAGVHSLRAYDIGVPYAAELAVLRGNYSGVQPGAIPTIYTPQEVIHFYMVWSNSASGNEREAQDAANKWLDEMKSARANEVGRINFLSCDSASCWVFDAAKRALSADQRLKPDRKELLSLMIAAMEDKAQPLPPLSKYFPAASGR